MTETLLAAVAVLAIIAIVLIDRRVRKAGALFTDLASPPMTFLALFLGVVFAALLFVQFSIEWLLVSVVLTTYGLGMPGLLVRLQRGTLDSNDMARSRGESRFLSFLRRWAFILAAAGAAIATAVWILARPDSGETLLVVLVVAFSILGVILGILLQIQFWIDLFKRLSR